MSHTYEIEIKSLLGSKENAEALISRLTNYDSGLQLSDESKQLNHYFNVPEGVKLSSLADLIPSDKKGAFDKILKEGKKISVRTRESNNSKVLLVMKASVGDDSSSNGVTRIEFEAQVPLSLSDLDGRLLKAGLTYQAKWSRERKEYTSKDLHICLDKNAGYGYLVEFEKVTTLESELEKTRKELLSVMKELGVEELAQDRLERMFSYYNTNWEQYYGTDKTFTIN